LLNKGWPLNRWLLLKYRFNCTVHKDTVKYMILA